MNRIEIVISSTKTIDMKEKMISLVIFIISNIIAVVIMLTLFGKWDLIK